MVVPTANQYSQETYNGVLNETILRGLELRRREVCSLAFTLKFSRLMTITRRLLRRSWSEMRRFRTPEIWLVLNGCNVRAKELRRVYRKLGIIVLR